VTIDFPAPQMPELSPAWIQDRALHLVTEIGRELPVQERITPKRVTIGVAAALVVAATLTLIAGVFGPATPDAFAGWVAAPDAASPSQVASANAACEDSLSSAQGALSGAQGTLPDSTLPPVALSDARGPFELLVYSSPTSTVLCLSSAGFTSLSGGGGGSNLGVPNQGSVTVDRTFFTTDIGQPYTVINGRIGVDVTKVVLTLSDGSTVQASTENGRFAAWWPSESGVSGALVSGASGTATQPLDISSPRQIPNGPPSG
jgi:hypothetical protein